jgi:hypothetical protein
VKALAGRDRVVAGAAIEQAATFELVINLKTAKALCVYSRRAWCAIWMATVYMVLATVSAITGETVLGGFDGWTYLDAAMALVLAGGLWRHWRAAAVSAVIYHGVSLRYTLWAWSDAHTRGIQSGLAFPFVGIVFLLAFINGVRGTFAFNRFHRFMENT